MRFLHAADIHLDSPLLGLERYEGAPVEEIRGATRRALENLVQVALEQEVDLVVLAGDLYDGDWRDYNTGLFFVRQVAKLREAGIPLFLIAGNHDAANKMTRSLRLPPNPAGDSPLFSHHEPETRLLPDLGVALHGQSFASQAERDNLARKYPQTVRGMFNIGILHTSLEGDEQHDTYAPCTLDDLRNKDYQYWALGHIHRRRVLGEEPRIAYPGNPQGRHIRESGPKGCLLVEVDDRQRVTHEFVALDVFRWETLEIPCAGATSVPDVLDRFEEQLRLLVELHASLPLGVRVRLTGPCEVHQELGARSLDHAAEIRAIATRVSRDRVWIEKIQFATTYPPRTIERAELEGPIEELLAVWRELRESDERLGLVAAELDALRARLPAELTSGPEPLPLNDPAWLRAILDEVQPLLLQRLTPADR
jgi:DNA repair protein SbcD/Mre11